MLWELTVEIAVITTFATVGRSDANKCSIIQTNKSMPVQKFSNKYNTSISVSVRCIFDSLENHRTFGRIWYRTHHKWMNYDRIYAVDTRSCCLTLKFCTVYFNFLKISQQISMFRSLNGLKSKLKLSRIVLIFVSSYKFHSTMLQMNHGWTETNLFTKSRFFSFYFWITYKRTDQNSTTWLICIFKIVSDVCMNKYMLIENDSE